MRRLVIISSLWALAGCGGGCGDAPSPAMRMVETGAFSMGSPITEPCRGADEERVAVTVGHRFALQAHEVTQRRFEAVMGYGPSFRRGCPTCPVERVSAHEAAAYCNALSRREGRGACYRCEGAREDVRCDEVVPLLTCEGYRLPTEVEWAWAVRGGDAGSTYGGRVASCMSRDEVADRIGWYKANAGGFTQPVGTLEPNDYGLYDMVGNVYEWTADGYGEVRGGIDPRGPKDAPERVVRGGSWYHNAHHLRSASRFRLPPEGRFSFVGFRCAKTVSS